MLLISVLLTPGKLFASGLYAGGLSRNILIPSSSEYSSNIDSIQLTFLVFNMSADERKLNNKSEVSYHIGMGLLNALQLQIGQTESSGEKDLRLRSEFTIGSMFEDFALYRSENVLDFLIVSLGLEHSFGKREDFVFMGIGIVLPFGEM